MPVVQNIGTAFSIPSDALEGVITATERTWYTHDDGATYPAPVTPKSTFTNVFHGSRTLSPSFFGLHVTNPSTYVPADIEYAWVRCHDSYNGTRWNIVNPSSGTFDYTNPDLYVNRFGAAGKDICFLLGFTPDWAATSHPNTGKYDNGTTATSTNQPPTTFTTWSTFCTNMATRYSARVKWWEIWNETNYTNYWAGTQAQLAQLVRTASQAIKAVDATAKILAPTVQEPETSGTGTAYLTAWMAASDGAAGTGKDWMDICSIHMYPPKYNFSIHAQQYDNVRAALDAAGKTGTVIWNTETGVLQGDTINAETRAKWLKRSLSLAAAKGIERYAWYAYDNDNMFMGAEDKAAWKEVRSFLLSGAITNCAIMSDDTVSITVNGVTKVY